MLCLTLINWYVFIICWGLNLKLYLNKEREKETNCGWLKNKSDRMTCRERWWWSNSWLGAFFFNFIFCLSCGISRPPWTIFFKFYYRRNSWVVSTFFFVFALDRRSFLFLRPFAPWVGDHPCPGAVVPWTSTTTAAIGQKIERAPTDTRTSKLKQNQKKTNENLTIPEIFWVFSGCGRLAPPVTISRHWYKLVDNLINRCANLWKWFSMSTAHSPFTSTFHFAIPSDAQVNRRNKVDKDKFQGLFSVSLLSSSRSYPTTSRFFLFLCQRESGNEVVRTRLPKPAASRSSANKVA
jgi:hypothetical protein